MLAILDKEELQRQVGRQLLGPLEDAMALAGRYRDVDAFRRYVNQRAHLITPVLVLIGVTALACGLAPILVLVGARAVSALAGLLLAPAMLIGSLFVLALMFISWLEERSLVRTLGRRAAPEPKAMRWIRKRLGADLGRAPRVPWLYAAAFLAAPFAMLLNFAPAIAAILLALLAVAPLAFARLDR